MISPATQAARLMERHGDPQRFTCKNRGTVTDRLRVYGYERFQLTERKSNTYLLWSTPTRARPDACAQWADGVLSIHGPMPRPVGNRYRSEEASALGPLVNVRTYRAHWDAVLAGLGIVPADGQGLGAAIREWYDSRESP